MGIYLRVASAIVAATFLGPKADAFVRTTFPDAVKSDAVSKAVSWGAPIGVGLGAFAVSSMLFGGGK